MRNKAYARAQTVRFALNGHFVPHETKIVASDMLPRLNYNKKALAAGAPLRTPLEVKQRITLQNISPLDGSLEWFSVGAQRI